MYVYFIQAGEDGPIKIGFAKHVGARLSTLQTDNHCELRILGVCNGDRDCEARTHQQFRMDHIRGEWFRPTKALLNHISTLSQHPHHDLKPKSYSFGDSGLARYLDSRCISIKEFAKSIKVSRETVRLYLKRDRFPRLEIMARIVEATDGQVQAKDFLEVA